MSESVTYIRVNMNGKWTNLGIIAESEDLKEHFWFVQGLLDEKERADRYEDMWEKALQYAQKEVDDEELNPHYPKSAGESILEYMKVLEDNQ